jgi:type VI secretion system protein ImpC
MDLQGYEMPDELIRAFLRQVVQPGQVISSDAETNLKHWIPDIDQKLSRQLSEIMHHPDFQRLEATWRGLRYLVDQTETDETLKIRVLNVSQVDLLNDFAKANQFDQSALFQKVYEEVYSNPSSEPFDLLISDYEFGRIGIYLLAPIARVAAFAHTPFVAAASSKLFGLGDFTELTTQPNVAKVFDRVAYAPWKSFRESEESRYVALTLPRVLARLPYGNKFQRVAEFDFDEFADGESHDKFLWMSAAWAYAARVTDAYGKYGWPMRTRGIEGGGKVEGLPVRVSPSDDGDVAMKCPTEIAISDRREFELANLGFLPLVHPRNIEISVFMGTQSCHKPKLCGKPDADAVQEVAAKISFTLCASRFAHYLMLIAQERFTHAFVYGKDLECLLNNWIKNYVAEEPFSSEESRVTHPLSNARIEVRAVQGKPGWSEMVIWLRFQLHIDLLTYHYRLVAEIPGMQG